MFTLNIPNSWCPQRCFSPCVVVLTPSAHRPLPRNRSSLAAYFTAGWWWFCPLTCASVSRWESDVGRRVYLRYLPLPTADVWGPQQRWVEKIHWKRLSYELMGNGFKYPNMECTLTFSLFYHRQIIIYVLWNVIMTLKQTQETFITIIISQNTLSVIIMLT